MAKSHTHPTHTIFSHFLFKLLVGKTSFISSRGKPAMKGRPDHTLFSR